MKIAALVLGLLGSAAFLTAAAQEAVPPAPVAVAPPSAKAQALVSLGRRFDAELAGERYSGFDPNEKRTITILAVNAAVMVDAGQCADPAAVSSAAEGALVIISIIGRKTVPPVSGLPPQRKAELLDAAMQLEAQRTPDAGFVGVYCNGRLLADGPVKPLAERRAVARQVLAKGLSPADSATSQAAPGAR